ncbi:MAG: phosphoglycerate kinase [Desulfobacterota bacterium]|nr:phosphoglycerate kinase [Thermodesulfobacteriota bacterium]
MAIKYIDEVDVAGKRVFVRADFNVPLDENGMITNDNRIRETVPTLRYILDHGGALIVASHLGRPKGKPDPKQSLAPVAKRLGELLGQEVRFVGDCVSDEAISLATALKPGEVLLLENLRFYPEEEKNDEAFARKLAAAAQVYVNDAFACSHRAHASVEAITRFVPVVTGGFLMKKELVNFERAMHNPERPLVAVIGGAKVSGKLEVLENIINKVDSLLIGGGMAFTFLKAQGYEIGASLVEDDLIDTAKKVLEKARARGVEVVLPVDCVIAEEVKAGVTTKTVSIKDIPKGWRGLDIGPATVKAFADVITRSKTVVWNGPMGVFEIPEFEKGTFAIADIIANAKVMSVVGGGDSVAALKKSGNQAKVTFVSTAGGAFMEMLEGKVLPGIKALDR